MVVRFKDAVKEPYLEGLWTRRFLSTLNTYLAWPWTQLFVVVGLTPNQVSILSFQVSLAGMATIALLPQGWAPGLGAGLLMLGLWWDHSDGQVARLTGKGTLGGGLLDTVFDRWVEGGWVLALGMSMALGVAEPSSWAAPWVVLVATGASIHATLYVRWANIQKDLYLLRQGLHQAVDATPGEGILEVDVSPRKPIKQGVRTFFIPFAFNRDVTLWLLALITVSGFWVEGLLFFAAVHIARGLEMNWYTLKGLQKGDKRAISAFLHPDYHK